MLLCNNLPLIIDTQNVPSNIIPESGKPQTLPFQGIAACCSILTSNLA